MNDSASEVRLENKHLCRPTLSHHWGILFYRKRIQQGRYLESKVSSALIGDTNTYSLNRQISEFTNCDIFNSGL